MADYTDIIPFIKKAEGGLSKASSDTASSNASPCVHNGVTGWHTNKGVQWATFSANANALGYSATCANFITMPESIWRSIFKKVYWDAYKLDNVRSQMVANTIVSWAWGSGATGAYNSLVKFIKTNYGDSMPGSYNSSNGYQVASYLDQKAKANEKSLLDKMTAWREDFFKSLGQPANLNGWLNRLQDFYLFQTNRTMSFVKRNWLPISLVGLGFGVLITALVIRSNRN